MYEAVTWIGETNQFNGYGKRSPSDGNVQSVHQENEIVTKKNSSLSVRQGMTRAYLFI